ncbi:efflux RND transporter periplasmic adaptor subunit [Methyloversatilis thermotolerans]|uniref:efflux RND transporter periplasmic adaptor subunit n=1 Tax=Methyloversatilis thermotolerans TaxID=1346290 RepID=UPI0003775BB0|nr:efflux RND transporter periplasmic adaptor subunit [Methyloversatilis thermotolerans]
MTTRTDLIRRAGLLSATVLALALAACGDKQEAGHANGGMPPAAVKVVAVAPQDVPVQFDYVGQVAGSREIEVRARITGIVEKRLYEEGERIKAGQIMFRIDPAPYQAAVAAAEAQLEQSRAQLKQAEREYARIKPLADAEAASRKDADDAESTRDLARAAVKAAEAQLQTARINLGYTDVRAPLGGVAGRAEKVEGALAVAGGDSLLTTLAQTDPAYVNFGVGEVEYLRTRDEMASGALKLDPQGFTVRLKGSDGADIPRTGKLGFHDYKADTSTGAFAVRATFDNKDGLLSPGQFVRVQLTGATRAGAIVVPQRAVLDSPQGKFVYVIGEADGKTLAQPRPVKLGEWAKLDGELGNAWVIRDGLKAGERVIVDGMARIFVPGSPVVIDDGKAAPQPAPAAPAGH